MKWFRHDTDAFMSEGIDNLIEEFGFEGYGRWNRLLEIVAFKMDHTDTCYVEYSISKWCRLLRLKRPKLRGFLEATQDQLKTKVVWTDDKLKIGIPNLLKKRDEYSRKSRHDPDKVRVVDIEGEREGDKEGELKKKNTKKKKVSAPKKNDGFEKFYQAYPKKKSRGQAEKTWDKLKPDKQLVDIMVSAIEQAKTSAQWKKDGGDFIPHPSTWLNDKGWLDEYSPVNNTPKNMQGLKAYIQENVTNEKPEGDDYVDI